MSGFMLYLHGIGFVCLNFVCNEGNVVQLSAPYITLCDFLCVNSNQLFHIRIK